MNENQSLYRTVEEFVADPNPPRNEWLVWETHTEVYLRKTKRFIEGKVVPAIDIANISTASEFRGRGRFWRLIFFLQYHFPTHYLYIENVLNPRLHQSLLLYGATEIPFDSNNLCTEIPCFYYKPTAKPEG